MSLDHRTTLICDAAADWAEPIREESLKMESDPTIDQEIADAKKIAQSAYEAHKKHDRFRNAIQYEQSLHAFYEASEQYFRLRVDVGRSMVRYRVFEIERLRKSWDDLLITFRSCNSLSDIELWLRQNLEVQEPLSHLVKSEPNAFETVKTRISQELEAMRSTAYENSFGAQKVYADFGKEAALRHFEDLQPKSRGRIPSEAPSPDVERAFEFSHIIVAVSERLSANKMREASDAEICEALFKSGSNPELYSRTDVIRWLVAEHLKAPSISVPGFLNSLSRGRSRVRHFVDWVVNANASRGK